MIVAFIDTNTLLHFQPLKDVDWCDMLGDTAITIMVCQPVLKELDKHKQNPRLSDRARARSREIEANLNQQVRPGVTIRFYAEPLRFAEFPDTLSPDSVDDQIVHCAVQFKQKHGGTVAIITDDTLMRLRSEGHGIKPVAPPEGQRLQNPLTEDQKKLRDAQAELADLKNRRPKLVVTLEPNADETLELIRPKLPEVAAQMQPLLTGMADKFKRWGDHRYDPKRNETYLKSVERWLENNRTVADESARTIAVKLSIKNTGNAPAKDIDLTVRFPSPLIMAISYDNWLDGERARHTRRPPELAHLPVELPQHYPTVPNPLWASNQSLPLFGRISQGVFTFSLAVMPHGDERTFPEFYLTFRTWEEVQPFQVEVTIRTLEPPNMETFEIPVKARVVESSST